MTSPGRPGASNVALPALVPGTGAQAGNERRISPDDVDILVRLFRLHGIRERSYPLAIHLLAQLGHLGEIVSATPDRLRRLGVLERELEAIALMGAAITTALKRRIEDRPILECSDAVVDYLHAQMAHLATESFRVLFLNKVNILVRDEILWFGTIDQAPAYPREVLIRALDIGAAALILVHNHPSGNPVPSRDDVIITRSIVDACRTVGIVVHDHLLITRSGHASLRAMGLM